MRRLWAVAAIYPALAAAAEYRVDCAREASLDAVNARVYAPGDRILLRAGCSWTGQLAPKGSGAAERPIVIDRYGEGPKPVIRGDGSEAAVLLHNQEYWEINNIEVTNDAPADGLRRGVLVRGGNLGRALRHFRLRGIDVHDVRGKLGADIVSKTTGGIAFEVRGTEKPARFDDVAIENCTVRHVDNTGIYLWSDFSPHPRDPRWAELRNTGVVIRGNRLSDIGKNAMGVRASLAPRVEGNIVERAAARLHGNAIYVFGCKDALIERNEVWGTRLDRIEGAAFDSDYNSEGTVIQYNYSHDNGGGLVDLCNNSQSRPPRGYNDGTVVRHNLSVNDVYRVFMFDGPVTNTDIHNNTVYVGKGLAPHIVEFDLFGKAPGYADRTRFRNNIIYNAGDGTYVWGKATNYTFEGNCFGGNHPAGEPEDAAKVTGDPGFVAPGTGRLGYRLKAGSPCAGKGATLE